MKNQSLASIIGNIVRASLRLAWSWIVHNERKKYRAKGCYIHSRAMLARKTSKGGGQLARSSRIAVAFSITEVAE